MKNQILFFVLSLFSISLHAGNAPFFIGKLALHKTALTNERPAFVSTISSNATLFQSDMDSYSWPVTIMGGVVVTLGENILLNQTCQYFIIGDVDVVFEGDNKTVTIDNVTDYPGLLQNGDGVGNDGYSNVSINNTRIHSNNTSLLSDGGWIGQFFFATNASNVIIRNCYSDGVITNFAGGITGSFSSCTVINSHSSGGISFGSGGIFGAYSGGTAINCYSTGAGANLSGGIFGYVCNGSASDCYSTGIIGNYGGGIFGYESNGIANRCYSTGNITSYGGGIAGAGYYGSIGNCYSTGDISSDAGGITGMDNLGSMTDSYSIGIIDPAGDGIGTNNGGTVTNCFAEGSGTWNDNNANSFLTGTDGSIWTDIDVAATNMPFKLASFNTSLYSPATENIPENALIISPGGNFGTGNYSIVSINNADPSLNSSVSINATSGMISFTNSGIGSFTSKILHTDNTDGSYQISVYTLNILSTLPVTWRSFAVTPRGNAAWLQWSTDSEQNTRDFKVQHSINGSNWTTIATITAAGISTAITNYSYLHDDPVTGNNYYRIQQTDLDGKYSYSSIQKLQIVLSSKSFTVLNTIVSNGVLQVEMKTSTLLYLYSNEGKLLWQKQFNAGLQNIYLSAVSTGVYLLKGKDGVEKILVR